MSRRRESDTATVIVGLLVAWGVIELLSRAGRAPGEGGPARERLPASEWDDDDTRDELAELPDEIEPRAVVLQKPKSTAKSNAKPKPPVIDVVLKKQTTKPPGTVSASPELEPHHEPTLTAGFDPVKARALAPGIAAHLATKGPKAYSRTRLKEWQRYAGLRVDGAYGGSSRGALVFYGVSDPPRPFVAPFATLPYQPPDAP